MGRNNPVRGWKRVITTGITRFASTSNTNRTQCGAPEEGRAPPQRSAFNDHGRNYQTETGNSEKESSVGRACETFNLASDQRVSRRLTLNGRTNRFGQSNPGNQLPDCVPCSPKLHMPGLRQALAAFTLFASLEIFLLAVFLCSTPLVTPRMISG